MHFFYGSETLDRIGLWDQSSLVVADMTGRTSRAASLEEARSQMVTWSWKVA